MEGIMERQEPLRLNIPDSVAVVGCGGVGSWTAYFLALAGVKELWLFDSDELSEHNLNRIPVATDKVGMKKSEAIKGLIHSVRPNCNVLAMGTFSPEVATSINLNDSIRFIVATTDTAASRRMVAAWADKNWVPYIEAAAEGEIGSCTGRPAEWSTPQETHPGYQSVPVWVGPCVFSAATAVAYIIHGENPGDRVMRMGWSRELSKFDMYDSDQDATSSYTDPYEQEELEKVNSIELLNDDEKGEDVA